MLRRGKNREDWMNGMRTIAAALSLALTAGGAAFAAEKPAELKVGITAFLFSRFLEI